MQAKMDDLDKLLEAQEFDLSIIRLDKQLSELPQPRRVAEARKKAQALQKKAEQVQALKKDAAKRLTRVTDEDASLEKKENGVQAAIDAAQGDYRNVEARTKELAGIAKRREVLTGDRTSIEAEIAKIDGLADQVTQAIRDVQRAEQQAIAEYQQQGGQIKQQISTLTEQRDALLVDVDSELVDTYRNVVKRLGSVALGALEGDRCSVCRSTVEGGRLIALRAQAPLGTCPTCSRLLIIAE